MKWRINSFHFKQRVCLPSPVIGAKAVSTGTGNTVNGLCESDKTVRFSWINDRQWRSCMVRQKIAWPDAFVHKDTRYTPRRDGNVSDLCGKSSELQVNALGYQRHRHFKNKWIWPYSQFSRMTLTTLGSSSWVFLLFSLKVLCLFASDPVSSSAFLELGIALDSDLSSFCVFYRERTTAPACSSSCVWVRTPEASTGGLSGSSSLWSTAARYVDCW